MVSLIEQEVDVSKKRLGSVRAGIWSSDLVPQLGLWNVEYYDELPKLEIIDGKTARLYLHEIALVPLLRSPEFTLNLGEIYAFQLDLDICISSPVALVLVESGENASDPENWLGCRAMSTPGISSLTFTFRPKNRRCVQLVLINYFGTPTPDAYIDLLGVSATATIANGNINTAATNTYLPHWGRVKRLIHDKCKVSRNLNSMVAALEMRLGREESLSLPMFLSFCPTGQCNAQCEFCSVTINRTGIIKKQLPYSSISKFMEPTLGTAVMYGVEGNGEPTIYKEFNALISDLQDFGAGAYLITNGALIEPPQVAHLLNLNSVTFSLNAASAETHENVMKLKEFNNIVTTIKSLVDMRGLSLLPQINVSFVVHETNVHELQDFLQFAEYELGVDVIMVRPLSELGSDVGSMEDLRQIVPYESQVQNALEAVEEYLNDVPRRLNPESQTLCEIRIEPDTFRAVRPDPSDRLLYHDLRIHAPRRRYWHPTAGSVDIAWHLNTMTVNFNCEKQNGDGEQTVLFSDSFPLQQKKDLKFRFSLSEVVGKFSIGLISGGGKKLKTITLTEDDSGTQTEVTINTIGADTVYFVLQHFGNSFAAKIKLHDVRSPERGILKDFKLPIPRRWQIDTPGVQVNWVDTKLLIKANAGVAGRYLYKSYSAPCLPGSKISQELRVSLRSGELVIGVLTEDFQNWVAQKECKLGEENVFLEFDTEQNRQVQIVIINKSNDKLDAEIDWKNLIEADPQRRFFETASEVEKPINNSSQKDDEQKLLRVPFSFGRLFSRKSRVKFYCQKPWTDVNNFSVDGRMDVCCIATGASQPEYQIGNINENTFQEIWNGKKLREFRRTVNTKNALPPCQRCPMAYSYQGLFFDRKFTIDTFDHKIKKVCGSAGLLGKFFLPLIQKIVLGSLSLLFSGFKK